MRSLTLALLATASLSVSHAALAQTIDQAGADALEAQIPLVLDQLLSASPQVEYDFPGEVEAVPSGDSYSVAIPGIDLSVDNDVNVSISAFTLDVEPQENGWQQAQWSLPSPIVATNPRNADDRAEINFSSEDNSMTIAPEYGMALQADIGFEDVLVQVDGEVGSLSIADVQLDIETELSGAGPHSFNSQSGLGLDALRIDVPTEDVFVEVAGLEMTGTTARQRLDLFAILQEEVSAVDPESEEFLRRFVGVLQRTAGEKWIGDADYSGTMTGLNFSIEDVRGTLETFSFAMRAEDLDEDTGDLGLTLEAAGISSPSIPPQLARVVPTQANLDIAAVDAPIDAISAEIYGVLGEPPAEEELFGPKGRRAGVGNPLAGLESLDPMTFLGLILNSDAALMLETLYLEAPIGYVAADGRVDPSAQAAFQATASFDIDIAGLPDMISFAQQMGGDAAQFAGLASAIAAMGRDGTDSDGVAIKEFELEITAAGQVLLNGNDMSAMMGMFQ